MLIKDRQLHLKRKPISMRDHSKWTRLRRSAVKLLMHDQTKNLNPHFTQLLEGAITFVQTFIKCSFVNGPYLGQSYKHFPIVIYKIAHWSLFRLAYVFSNNNSILHHINVKYDPVLIFNLMASLTRISFYNYLTIGQSFEQSTIENNHASVVL